VYLEHKETKYHKIPAKQTFCDIGNIVLIHIFVKFCFGLKIFRIKAQFVTQIFAIILMLVATVVKYTIAEWFVVLRQI